MNYRSSHSKVYINPKLEWILSNFTKRDVVDIPLISKLEKIYDELPIKKTIIKPYKISSHLFNIWNLTKCPLRKTEDIKGFDKFKTVAKFTEKIIDKIDSKPIDKKNMDYNFELITKIIFGKDFPIIRQEKFKFLREFKCWTATKTMENGHFKKYYYGKFVHSNDFITDCMNNSPIEEKYLPIFADLMNLNLVIIKSKTEMIFSNLYDADRKTIYLNLSTEPYKKDIIRKEEEICRLMEHSEVMKIKESFEFPKYTEKELLKMKYEEIAQIALSNGISIYKQGATKVIGLTKGDIITQLITL